MTIKEFKTLLETAEDDFDISAFLEKKEVVVLNPEIATTSYIPEEGMPANIRHSVNSGDLIAAMGAIKKYYELTGRKVVVIQTINMAAAYYSGAEHPVVDEQGRNVTVNSTVFEMLKPLIESQKYVHSMEVYTGQRVDVDFDVIRGKTFVNLPHGPIQGWIPLAFPDLIFDISKPWMEFDDSCPFEIKGQVQGKVLLNFTARYRAKIDYFFLKNYAPDLIFSGTEKEHWDFCNTWGLTIPRLQIKNFLDLAYAVKECRFTVGNQSMLWGLSQACGKPRILEMCNYADNCFPGIGDDSHGYFYQAGAEYAFRQFYNKFK